jgi:CII-binding regulator of phage lambda lysogenization HflD
MNRLNTLNKLNDKELLLSDNLNPIDKENIELALREIDNKIEELGKIADNKLQKSHDEFNSVLKQKKTQHQDELTKLNFKLMEAIKQNTREDFLTKLKNDLKNIQDQVYEKDKQLQSNLYTEFRKSTNIIWFTE